MSYALAIFFAALIAAVAAAETTWLSRKGWATHGRAWLFVIASDLIGLGVGGFVSFSLFAIMLMMTFGPAGTGGTSSEASYWFLIALALLFPPVILSIVKRIFMLFFSMPSGKAAWIFSLVAGFGSAAIIAVPPPLLYYLLSQFAR